MYQYHSNLLSIPARLLYDDLELMSYDNYNKACTRGKIKRTKEGKGKGNEAFVAFESLDPKIQKVIVEALGPATQASHIIFTDYINYDDAANRFFKEYTLDNGDPLPEKNIKEYIANAQVLNAIGAILNSTMSRRKALGSKVKPWEKIMPILKELPRHTYPHSLPGNEKRLRDKYNLYMKNGYSSLIHSGFGHKNSEKLNDEAKSWVLARWSDRVKKCTGYTQLLREYNQMAGENDWKELKTEQSLINFLTDPKIEPLWYGYRYSELKSKEKYNYQHTTKLPSLRDALWYSDGTKLNYYYQDENGKVKTTQVYEVFDTYSEVFIGYHISDSENFEAQYHAFKMALQISGHKPYEIKFDNQGGTKKLEAQSFLGKLARITTRTAPYNGKSKTIENAFARFQQEYLKQDWFFTGQNIQAKKAESKANMEFILANKKSLPTLEQIKETYKNRRQEWNQGKHPKTGKPRLEMYLNSVNPATPEVSIWDMMDMFWIAREKPITCTAYGIGFKDKNTEYNYMVYNEDRMPDLVWLRQNIDKKFIVKYDPDDMTLIQLYENTPLGLRRVCSAETKVEIHRSQQEKEAWEDQFFKTIDNENKRLRVEARDKMDSILEQHQMRPEDYGLTSPKLMGIETKKKKKGKPETVDDIGQFQKKVSNLVTTIDDDDFSDLM
ncbi:transposase family protein [Flavobacterium fluviatile]|uniref:transposase family protein n=1 Tax=Flavobacterium fluviatile TaxID=1862387 RepID=UPI0013CF7EC8|nr:transposase family protein [Flavobacterium fluviatile]